MQICTQKVETARESEVSHQQSPKEINPNNEPLPLTNKSLVYCNNLLLESNISLQKVNLVKRETLFVPKSAKYLTRIIAAHLDSTLVEIKSGTYLRAVSQDRTILSVFLRLKYGFKVALIAKLLNRSHCVVSHHCKTFFSDCNDPKYLEKVKMLESRLNEDFPGKGNLVLSTNQINTRYRDYFIR